MRRAVASFAVLLFLAPAAIAQDGGDQPTSQPAKSTTGRVSVGVTSELDAKEERPNLFQYYLWERLNAFGLRVDSQSPIGRKDLQAFIDKNAATWTKREPDAGPATLKVSGKRSVKYFQAEFYGEKQANVFKGSIELTLEADGKKLDPISFYHEWGKSMSAGKDGPMTKKQVKQYYDQRVFKTAAMAMLKNEAVQALMSEAKRKKANAWIEKERKALLKTIDPKGTKTSELVVLLRKLGEKKKDDEK